MNGQPFPHRLEEIDSKRQVGKVDEHGKDRRVGRGRLARRVLWRQVRLRLTTRNGATYLQGDELRLLPLND
jgi:hypothetical protein